MVHGSGPIFYAKPIQGTDMLRTIILETPGVIDTLKSEQTNIHWKSLFCDAEQQGVRIISASYDNVSGTMQLSKQCAADESLLIASTAELLSQADILGIPCIAFGPQVPAYRTAYHILSPEGAEFYYLLQVHQRLSGEAVVIAQTERLLIREMTVEDAGAMWEIQHGDEVRLYIDGFSDDKQAEEEKHIAYVKNVYPLYGYGLWAVCLKESGKLIGRCGIQDCECNGKCETELGYLFDPAVWGQGYATEAVRAVVGYAFSRLEMQSIIALIKPENERSVRVAMRSGMKFQQYVIRNGEQFACFRISNISIDNYER